MRSLSVPAWLQAGFLALALFATALFFFTRENRFPFYYHPDEPDKVEQVRTGKWNYHHPMLMLTTARVAVWATGASDAQSVVEAGRFISAAFCAGAVLLLSLGVAMLAGRFAALGAAALLMTNHQLFELAHYFKEDASLLFGIAAWFCAVVLYGKRPGWATAALVGAGAALAVSGKYLGVFAPLLSLWLVPAGAEKGRRAAAFGCFVAALAAVFAVVNFPLLSNLAGSAAGLDREMALVAHGQRGTTRSVPHTVYFTAFQQNVIFLLWFPLFWFYRDLWQRRREIPAARWTLALFPLLLLGILSFSPKTNDRYFLPATAFFLCGVAIGADALRRRWPRRLPEWLLLCAFVGVQTPDLAKYIRAFRHDDLRELTQWLNTELPHATLAIDRKVMLPSPRYEKYAAWQPPLSAKIVPENIESFRDMEALRAAGVTHLILSESAYGRYRRKSLRPQADAAKSYHRKAALYRTLQDVGKPLWERPRGTVTYLHPGLEVYRLPAGE